MDVCVPPTNKTFKPPRTIPAMFDEPRVAWKFSGLQEEELTSLQTTQDNARTISEVKHIYIYANYPILFFLVWNSLMLMVFLWVESCWISTSLAETSKKLALYFSSACIYSGTTWLSFAPLAVAHLQEELLNRWCQKLRTWSPHVGIGTNWWLRSWSNKNRIV